MVKQIRKSVDKIREECDNIEEQVEDIEPKRARTHGDPCVTLGEF